MKLYTKIKHLLEEYPELRDSDKKLTWRLWKEQGMVTAQGAIYMRDFFDATGFDTISRARRKVQEEHPELQSSAGIRRTKQMKEQTKGTFVYHEDFTGKLF